MKYFEYFLNSYLFPTDYFYCQAYVIMYQEIDYCENLLGDKSGDIFTQPHFGCTGKTVAGLKFVTALSRDFCQVENAGV